MVDFSLVYERMFDAKAITWDTCHKIYLLMDDAQVEQMREYEYDPIITKDEMSDGAMFDLVKQWYEDSCALRFVEAITTMPEGEDANEGFETLIGQGESDEEECEDCLEIGCYGACYVEEDEEDDEY